MNKSFKEMIDRGVVINPDNNFGFIGGMAKVMNAGQDPSIIVTAVVALAAAFCTDRKVQAAIMSLLVHENTHCLQIKGGMFGNMLQHTLYGAEGSVLVLDSNPTVLFNGKCYDTSVLAYHELPWEVEAYGAQLNYFRKAGYGSLVGSMSAKDYIESLVNGGNDVFRDIISEWFCASYDKKTFDGNVEIDVLRNTGIKIFDYNTPA